MGDCDCSHQVWSVGAIELDYVALNRDFLFTTMGQLYRRLINILSYGHEEILYIIN